MSTTRIKDLVTGSPTGPEFLVFDSASGGTRKVALSSLFAAFSGTLDFNGQELSNIGQLNATEVDASLVASSVFFAGLLSPTSIGANQNDYAPTGFASSSFVRLTASGAYSITGLAAGANGRLVAIVNVGNYPITLPHESASSTAANRWACPYGRDFVLRAGKSIFVSYDTTSSRWRVLAADESTGSRTVSTSTDSLTAADVGRVIHVTYAGTCTITLPDLSAEALITGGATDLPIEIVGENIATAVKLVRASGVKVDGYAVDYTAPTGKDRLRLVTRDGLNYSTGRLLTRDRVQAALGSALTSWLDKDSWATPISTAAARYPDLSSATGATPWNSPNGNAPAPGYTINRRAAVHFNGSNAYIRRTGFTLADHYSVAEDHVWWVGRLTAAPPGGALNDSTSAMLIGSAGADRAILVGGTGAPYDVRASYLQTTPNTLQDATASGVLALNTTFCAESSRKTGSGLTLRFAGVDATGATAATDLFRLTSEPFIGTSQGVTNFITGEVALAITCNAQITGDARQMVRDYIAQEFGVST